VVAPSQYLDQLGQILSAAHEFPSDEHRLAHVTERHDQAQRRHGVSQGDHAGDMTERAVQTQFATEGATVQARSRELTDGYQEADGDR
jgi:hypothetical protein